MAHFSHSPSGEEDPGPGWGWVPQSRWWSVQARAKLSAYTFSFSEKPAAVLAGRTESEDVTRPRSWGECGAGGLCRLSASLSRSFPTVLGCQQKLGRLRKCLDLVFPKNQVLTWK